MLYKNIARGITEENMNFRILTKHQLKNLYPKLWQLFSSIDSFANVYLLSKASYNSCNDIAQVIDETLPKTQRSLGIESLNFIEFFSTWNKVEKFMLQLLQIHVKRWQFNVTCVTALVRTLTWFGFASSNNRQASA